MNAFVFDIKTVPDVAAGRRLYGHPQEMAELEDKDVVRVMMLNKHNQETLRPHLHRIVVISVAARSGNRFKFRSYGKPGGSEAELLKFFFEDAQHKQPVLISWGGNRFQQPVLRYRALLHGSRIADGCLNRSERHIDVKEALAGSQAHAYAPMEEIAEMLGFPDDPGLSAAEIRDIRSDEEFSAIRDNCEVKVLNTYLVYLRYLLMCRQLNAAAYASECQQLRDYLATARKPHFKTFLDAWDMNYEL